MLDVGIGMRPELTGQGRGREFAAASRAGQSVTGARRLRAVVQDWNARSRRVLAGLGFVRAGTHPGGPVTYAVLERPVRPG